MCQCAGKPIWFPHSFGSAVNLRVKILTDFQLHLYLYETKADMDKELLAHLVNFIKGLYTVSAVPSNEPL